MLLVRKVRRKGASCYTRHTGIQCLDDWTLRLLVPSAPTDRAGMQIWLRVEAKKGARCSRPVVSSALWATREP